MQPGDMSRGLDPTVTGRGRPQSRALLRALGRHSRSTHDRLCRRSLNGYKSYYWENLCDRDGEGLCNHDSAPGSCGLMDVLDTPTPSTLIEAGVANFPSSASCGTWEGCPCLKSVEMLEFHTGKLLQRAVIGVGSRWSSEPAGGIHWPYFTAEKCR